MVEVIPVLPKILNVSLAESVTIVELSSAILTIPLILIAPSPIAV